MGFVGGGDNIAIATALPPSSFVYCIVNTRQFLDFLYLFFFYACLRLRFQDVKTKPCTRRPFPAACKILRGNVRVLAGNLSDRPWRRLGITYCCALRLWSQICVTCYALVPGFIRPH